ncbi:MAG: family acetyltransferase [Holophagaceae bacterium]|nr:family acetyltransferase [Holophagaceae bacterium]
MHRPPHCLGLSSRPARPHAHCPPTPTTSRLPGFLVRSAQARMVSRSAHQGAPMNDIQIMRTTLLLDGELDELVRESEAEGFEFVGRLRDEWNSRHNRFDQPGEVFFTARLQGRLVGICGLNRDPYSGEPGVGRVRRMYVRKEFRRFGIGRLLLSAITEVARDHFSFLSLRTDNAIATQFYERQGFQPSSRFEGGTHLLSLPRP